MKSINEEDQIRLPMALDISFLDIVKDKNLNSVLKKLIPGRYILNQQNGVVNPPKNDLIKQSGTEIYLTNTTLLINR